MRGHFILALLVALATSGVCRAQVIGEEPLTPITTSVTRPFLFDTSVSYTTELYNSLPNYNNEGYSDLYFEAARRAVGLSFDAFMPRLPFLSAGIGAGVEKESYRGSYSWTGDHPTMSAYRIVPDVHFKVDFWVLYLQLGASCAILMNADSFQTTDPVYAGINPDCLTPSVFYGYAELGIRVWRVVLAIGNRHYWSEPFDIDRLSYYKRYQYRSASLGNSCLFFRIGIELFSNYR